MDSLLKQKPLFRRACPALLVLGGLFLLYFLSAGPAIRMAQSRTISTDAVVAAYAPLFFAMDMFPGGDWLTEKYIGLWELPEPL